MREEIVKLDLTKVKKRLMEFIPKGKHWNQEKVDHVEAQYKQFLQDRLDGIDTEPNRRVMTMWHHHMIDTRAYEKDCMDIFGYFLHCDPYSEYVEPPSGPTPEELRYAEEVQRLQSVHYQEGARKFNEFREKRIKNGKPIDGVPDYIFGFGWGGHVTRTSGI